MADLALVLEASSAFSLLGPTRVQVSNHGRSRAPEAWVDFNTSR